MRPMERTHHSEPLAIFHVHAIERVARLFGSAAGQKLGVAAPGGKAVLSARASARARVERCWCCQLMRQGGLGLRLLSSEVDREQPKQALFETQKKR